MVSKICKNCFSNKGIGWMVKIIFTLTLLVNQLNLLTWLENVAIYWLFSDSTASKNECVKYCFSRNDTNTQWRWHDFMMIGVQKIVINSNTSIFSRYLFCGTIHKLKLKCQKRDIKTFLKINLIFMVVMWYKHKHSCDKHVIRKRMREYSKSQMSCLN